MAVNYRAYRQITPLKGDVAADMQNQQQLNNQKRNLDLEEKRTQELRAQAKEKKKEELATYIQSKTPKNIDTKVKSLSEVGNIQIQKARDRIGEIGIALMEDSENSTLTYQERAKLTSELESLNQLPENLKMASSAITEKANLYTKELAAGKIRRNPEFEKFMDIGTNGVYAELGPDGKPLLAYDTNQDGKIDVLDFENITSGLKDFQFKRDYDYEDVVNDLSSKMQSEINEKVKGGLIVKTTGLNQDELNSRVKSALYNPDGSPSEILEAIAERRNVPLLSADGKINKKGLDAIEIDMKNTLLLRSKKGVEEKPNTEVRQQAEFAYKKKRDLISDRKDKEKQELDINTETVVEGRDPDTGLPTRTVTKKVVTKTPSKNSSKTKTYSATQEKAIKIYMQKNPDYTREEIIAALKL